MQRGTTKEKANYRRCDWDTVLENMKKEKRPTTADEFQEMMDKEIGKIPRRRGDGQNRLPADLLALRRQMRKLARSKEKHEEYHLTRNKYRNQLKEYINAKVEKQLEEADEPGVFELCKRGKRKRVMQYLTRGTRTYKGRKEMAECMATHQGAGERKEEEKEEWREIEEVAEWEIQDAAKRSPNNSANGADDASLRMALTANQAHPGALRAIFTDILRKGKHPQIWKDADVVPIPKAKKATYTTPKSWRAIHLLRVISKLLERIVLRRLQDGEGEEGGELGKSQFGSRRNRGTTDAMTTLLRWKKEVRRRGHYQSIIVADIEGGFDKVDPEALHQSPLDAKYIPWIKSWARHRTMRMRINGGTDDKVYTTNQGIPQGLPLSPCLFCAHITEVMKDRITDTGSHTTMVISYVDDVAICVSAQDKKELEGIARKVWKEMKQKAREIGMDFAQEKTKTGHDHEAGWSIGKKEDKIRFLGYFITKPRPVQRTQEEDWTAHVSHWQTKGNLVFNIIRAMTQRTERGLRTVPALQLLYTCTRTMLHYGIEFWGNDEKQAKATDAYMYEALRRLFDIPIATPHRALSSEFALPPTEIQWEYVRKRLGERRRRYDPTKGIEWKTMEIESKGKGSTLPWKIKSANLLEHMSKGDTADWEKNKGYRSRGTGHIHGRLAQRRESRVRDSSIDKGIY